MGNISRKIAQCVTELATAAEQLKDEDWVNPSDPNWIAENELLGAAKAIENEYSKQHFCCETSIIVCFFGRSGAAKTVETNTKNNIFVCMVSLCDESNHIGSFLW